MQFLKALPCGDTRVSIQAYGEDFDRRYAVELGKKYFVELRAYRTVSIIDAEIIFYRYQSDDVACCIPMRWSGHDKGKDIYSAFVEGVSFEVGLYSFLVKLNTPEGTRYVETGVDENGWLLDYIPFQKTKQFLVYKRNYPACEWIAGGIIYQIFVDRFYRGKDTRKKRCIKFRLG